MPRWSFPVGLGVGGFLYACVIVLNAVGLGGAGHGWISASISALAIFLVPTFGLALAVPSPDRLKVLGAIAWCMVLTDILLVAATMAEGISYVSKVWPVHPWGLVLWAVL